jgi:hypothetical protein
MCSRKVMLKKPTSSNTADQCREMGIGIGNVICGREAYANGDWTEAKLEVLFLGEECAVFKESRRSKENPVWRKSGESSNWTLNCRDWMLVG